MKIILRSNDFRIVFRRNDTLRIFSSGTYGKIRLSVSLLKIDGADTRSVQKTPAGTVKNVRPVHFLPTCLLRKHAAAENHRRPWRFCYVEHFQKRHGCRWVISEAIFRLLPKFAIKSVHGCTLLMMRRSRCPYRKPFKNSDTGYKARTKIKRSRTCCTVSIYFCAATP